MDISIIIPLLNEAESLPELFSWIEKVMKDNNFSYEIIAVDDGSKDDSWKVIEQAAQKNPSIKGIRFQRNYGKSAALQVAFEAAQGDVVITMDADLQDSPDEIPELYKMIKNDGFHLVSGWKKKRYDPLTKTIPTKLFNAVTRSVSGIHNLHDFNCGLKAYQKNVVKNIEVYGEMHRYIPVIAKWNGFDKITEKPVQHQERKYGKTKFGLERFIYGFLDLMSITFVSKYGKRPMHIFGTLGVLSFFFGLLILIYLTVTKLFFGVIGMTDRPIFYLGILTVIVGTQLFVAGFLGELVARNSNERNAYSIKEKVNL
ncbi:MAG: glycosyltransferase family 2 protein [Chitinophagales bacterium]|nr:glycosyltransferase family 2 protein [Bacteroidota bacterium]